MKTKRKRQRARPRHWMFTPRWFNPILYLGIIICIPIAMFDGGFKEWWKETIDLFKNYVY